MEPVAEHVEPVAEHSTDRAPNSGDGEASNVQVDRSEGGDW